MRVVAGQAILKAQKLAQKLFAVLSKFRKVHTGLAPTYRCRKRDHKNVQKIMPLRIPAPRVRNPRQNRQQ